MKMRNLLFALICFSFNLSYAQTYTTTIDTFYVPTPEFSVSLGLDSLFFPCAITQPDAGTNFPVLILIHGTSALDKDANSTKDYKASPSSPIVKAQTRMFYEIADSLSRNGIVVLRYDKRSFTVGCIEKPACWFADTITPYDYIKDANYAVEFAKSLPFVDTCNIFVAGHSQGGSFSADLGLKRDDIRGVIGLAPTAQPIDTVAVYQTEFIDGDPSGALILRDQFDSLRNGDWPMTDTLYNQHFSPRFWLDWISITDSAIITQQEIDVPTIFLYGTNDAAVPPAFHLQLWQDSISRPDVTYVLFDSLDHSFGTIYDSTMASEVFETMIDWIHNNSVASCFAELEQLSTMNDYLVYPNPVSEQLSINATNQEQKTYYITSSNGQVIRQGTFNLSVAIDVSSLKKGIYFLRIKEIDNIQVYKVVKL